jgi:hypothetical protein
MTSKYSPTRFSEQGNVKLKVINPFFLEIEVSPIFIINPDVEKPREGITKECTDLGFKNKKVGHQILRKLRKRSDTRLSSISLIDINECSDPKIKEFLVLEDLDL